MTLAIRFFDSDPREACTACDEKKRLGGSKASAHPVAMSLRGRGHLARSEAFAEAAMINNVRTGKVFAVAIFDTECGLVQVGRLDVEDDSREVWHGLRLV